MVHRGMAERCCDEGIMMDPSVTAMRAYYHEVMVIFDGTRSFENIILYTKHVAFVMCTFQRHLTKR